MAGSSGVPVAVEPERRSLGDGLTWLYLPLSLSLDASGSVLRDAFRWAWTQPRGSRFPGPSGVFVIMSAPRGINTPACIPSGQRSLLWCCQTGTQTLCALMT